MKTSRFSDLLASLQTAACKQAKKEKDLLRRTDRSEESLTKIPFSVGYQNFGQIGKYAQ